MQLFKNLFWKKRDDDSTSCYYSEIPENMELRVNLLHGDLKAEIHDRAWLVHKENKQCWCIENYWNKLSHTEGHASIIRHGKMQCAIDELNKKNGLDYVGTRAEGWLGSTITEFEWYELLLSQKLNLQ